MLVNGGFANNESFETYMKKTHKHLHFINVNKKWAEGTEYDWLLDLIKYEITPIIDENDIKEKYGLLEAFMMDKTVQ